MSQRTIVEFNHDRCHMIEVDPELFASMIARALKSGSDREWAPLEHFGIRKGVQCHHSDERAAVAGGRTYPFP